MAIVTRTFIREPSNSKCHGSTRCLLIGNHSFSAGELRGTGVASAELPTGPAVVTIAGTFAVGSGARKRTQRREIKIDVIVTDNPGDECVVMLDGAQPIEVRLTGCTLVAA